MTKPIANRMPTAEEIIATLGLTPHPEGGFYRETYRAAGRFGRHHFATAIYFLLPRGYKSALHRIKSDEVWHHYLGGPLHVAEITPQGLVKDTLIGSDLAAGERPQYVVEAGHWFGSYPDGSSDFALVGCTVSPGFEFSDFEMGRRDELLRAFPHARDLIIKLTD